MLLFALVAEGKSYGIFAEARLEFNESTDECQEPAGWQCANLRGKVITACKSR
jgi:hypothetical protein